MSAVNEILSVIEGIVFSQLVMIDEIQVVGRCWLLRDFTGVTRPFGVCYPYNTDNKSISFDLHPILVSESESIS